MLGHKIYRLLGPQADVFAAFRNPPELWDSHPAFARLDDAHARGGVDASCLDSVRKVITEVHPQVVINCIGIVKQRDEARMAIPAIQINALFPHQLADLCEAGEARLIHLSTDCVFSGKRGHYTEADLPDPPDLYGRTKLLGELDRRGCLTLRTSLIGWELKRRAGLLEWFAAQRDRTIRGYRRAIFTGLSTTELAELVSDLLQDRPELSGVFHVASQPISKYELLIRLRTALGWEDILIEPDDEFFCDRSLDGSRFTAATGWRPADWEQMIADLAGEWPRYEGWRKMAS